MNQPLIRYKEKFRKDIYLLPEFCSVTGLTDKMRANFRIMKEISKTTKPRASARLESC
jgi:hypothetical protein